MNYKQEIKTTIYCECGVALDLWTSGALPETYFDCSCGRTYVFKILETSVWSSGRVVCKLLIEEDKQ